MTTSDYILIAATLVGLLGTAYPAIRRSRQERRAKALFFEFKRRKAEEGPQTYTCRGCGYTTESVGIPAKWISRPSQNDFCCSEQCLEDATREWAKRIVVAHFAKRKTK